MKRIYKRRIYLGEVRKLEKCNGISRFYKTKAWTDFGRVRVKTEIGQ